MSLSERANQAIAGFTFLALFAPAVALAQFAPLAPVAAGDSTTHVDLVANLSYDSNVSGFDPAAAAARHLSPSDIIIEPDVRVQLARPVGRQTLYLTGNFGYDAYVRNSRLDRENISVNPGVIGQFSRCQYDLSGSYARAQTSLQELALTPGGLTPADIRNTQVTEQVTAGADCGGQVGFAPTARVTGNWTRNASPIYRAIDVNAFSTQEGISYRRPSIGNITLFGAYSNATYPDRLPVDSLLGLPTSTLGYQTFSGGLSYTRPLGARLIGSASLSYTDLQNTSPGIKGFSGLTYSASLNYAVNPRLSASASITRATVPSNRLDSSFQIDDSYSVRADYRLTERGSVGIGASYDHENFGVLPGIVRFDLSKQTIYEGTVHGEYRLNRRLSLALNLDQSHRSANFPGLTYSDTRATLSVRATF